MVFISDNETSVPLRSENFLTLSGNFCRGAFYALEILLRSSVGLERADLFNANLRAQLGGHRRAILLTRLRRIIWTFVEQNSDRKALLASLRALLRRLEYLLQLSHPRIALHGVALHQARPLDGNFLNGAHAHPATITARALGVRLRIHRHVESAHLRKIQLYGTEGAGPRYGSDAISLKLTCQPTYSS